MGLTLAAELARHGVRPRIVDRLATPSPYCRAIGVTPRTLEVWEDMGVVREMIDAGLWLTGMRSIVDGQVRDAPIDLADLPYAMLGLPQYETERILTKHLALFGITVERGTTLESLTQSDGTVHTTLVAADGSREEATFRYVVGCDGAHSAVRRALGIAFDGDSFPFSFMLGDVHIAWDLPRGMTLRALRPILDSAPDMFIAIPLPEPGRYRVTMLAPPKFASEGTGHGIQSEQPAPGIEALQAVADRLLSGKPALGDLRWSSIFRISMRLAAQYRQGNAFLAGDAAHIHPPTGGQGMNTGIQDAYNLAWKLALVVKGTAPESLLESYEAERRPVGAEVVANTTRASQQLGRESGDTARLAETQVLVNYRDTPWVSGIPAATGPNAGDRVPDCVGLRRQGVGHPLRLFELIRGTEHVLLGHNVSMEALLHLRDRLRVILVVDDVAGVFDRPDVACYVDAEGQFRRIFGTGPTRLLIRPDGYVAWRGDATGDMNLADVLSRTFDRPSGHTA